MLSGSYDPSLLRDVLLPWWHTRGLIPPPHTEAEPSHPAMDVVWKAAKFALMHLESWTPQPLESAPMLAPADRWMLHRLGCLPSNEPDALFAQLQRDLSWYVELSKLVLYDTEDRVLVQGDIRSTRTVLAHLLQTIACILTPLAPLLAEMIWQHLPGTEPPMQRPSVLRQPAPKLSYTEFEADAQAMEATIEVLALLKDLRATHNLKPHDFLGDIALNLPAERTVLRASLEHLLPYVRFVARPSAVAVVVDASLEPKASTRFQAVTRTGIEVLVAVQSAQARTKERLRLSRELAKVDEALIYVRRRLADSHFVERAPADVVQGKQERLRSLMEQKEVLEEALEAQA